MLHILFVLSLAFSVRQLRSCFPALVDGAFQVLGQLEYFNQRDELLFGELVIINARTSMTMTEAVEMADALGYDIVWQKRER